MFRPRFRITHEIASYSRNSANSKSEISRIAKSRTSSQLPLFHSLLKNMKNTHCKEMAQLLQS